AARNHRSPVRHVSRRGRHREVQRQLRPLSVSGTSTPLFANRNRGKEVSKMRKVQDLLARIFDVFLVLLGATVAAQIRFDYLGQSGFYWVLVMFSAAFALAIFPAFGVYESWRGRSQLALACQVSLPGVVVH